MPSQQWPFPFFDHYLSAFCSFITWSPVSLQQDKIKQNKTKKINHKKPPTILTQQQTYTPTAQGKSFIL